MRGGHDEAWIITGIAHHYNAAGDQPAALKAAVEAAEEVSRLQAFHEAAALLDRAVALWPRVAEPEALTGIDHPEILMRCARAHYLWGADEVAILAKLVTGRWMLYEPDDEEKRAALLRAIFDRLRTEGRFDPLDVLQSSWELLEADALRRFASR